MNRSQPEVMRRALTGLGLLAILAVAPPADGSPVRVKDLVSIEGADPVEAYGYGLVMGLNGTGDGRSISYTRQSISNLLERMGLTVHDDRIRAKNVASAIVTATITPWDRPGSLVDITVSSMGDATSLAGGFLLLTELHGPDGVLYATGQGALSVGGFDFTTFSGSRVRRNYVTTGRVPEGGRIIAAPTFRVPTGIVHLFLDEPDFTQSQLIATALSAYWNDPGIARSVDAGQLSFDVGRAGGFAAAMADLDLIQVEPVVVAKVVINERTGTLVAGGDIRIQPATVAHSNLHVRIESAFYASQPAPFSRTGQTVILPETTIGFDTGQGSVVSLPPTTTADDLATALNALGVEPRDLIAIFQALKEVGALPAKMEIL